MGLNILSLFDGMSCGQQALERAGITVDNYFASEIDKYAMQVTMANYRNTKQLGSVVNVNGSDLPKIDLLIGGSPCQSFSFAGKRKGMATKCETEILTLNHYLDLKADGYEFEGQSYLFWEFMRLLNECEPKYFLLENVEMGEKWERVLSKAIGVNGIHINSSLVSAQNRKRIYWTNIGMQPGGLFGDLVSIIEKPKDKGILLKDVLENEVGEKYFLSDKMVDYLSLNSVNQLKKGNGFSFKPTDGNKKGSAITDPGKNRMDDNYIKIDRQGNIKNNQNKASSLSVGGHGHGNHSDMDLIVHSMMPRSSTTGKGGTGHLSKSDGKTYCLDTGNSQAVEYIKIDRKGNLKNNQNKASTLSVDGHGNGNHSDMDLLYLSQAVEIKRRIIVHDIPKIVSVRKFEVNILSLQKTLKEHKKLNNQQIADALEVPKTNVEHWFRTDTYFSIPDKDIWLKLKEILEIKTDEFDEAIMTFEEKEGVFEKSNRVYDENGIFPTLTTMSENDRIINNSRIRRLTPIECERLQTVKDNYTNHVSDSQRYKMLGNGWTVDVIAHIFNYLK